MTRVLPAALALLVASTAHGDPLADALLRGDPSELSRAGRAAAAGQLARGLAAPDRLSRIAAARAAPWAEDGWELLLALADLAGAPDRSVATAAAASAVVIASSLDPGALDDRDVPRDEAVRRMRAWRDVAARPDRWPDVRVLALETTAHLSRALHPGDRATAGYDLTAMLGDADPEIRRAALELLPSPPEGDLLATAAAAIAGDGDSLVAVAAGQAVCASFSRPALSALGPDGLSRARALIADPTLPAPARLDTARCVAADHSPETAAALRKLAATVPDRMRSRVRELEGAH